jgi:hypothetical protein
VPITTNIESLNPAYSEVYLIQYYVIKFVSYLLRYSQSTPVSSTNKTDCHDTTELLLNEVFKHNNPWPNSLEVDTRVSNPSGVVSYGDNNLWMCTSKDGHNCILKFYLRGSSMIQWNLVEFWWMKRMVLTLNVDREPSKEYSWHVWSYLVLYD